MSAFDWVGVTLIVINTALFLVVFASLPLSIKRGIGVIPSFIYLLTTAATVVWIWRTLQWQV
jgi:hypothetical protein